MPATLETVAGLAAGLPGVTEEVRHGNRAWAVGGKVFAWERPFSKADLRRFGDDPVPEGPILALRVDDLAEKEASLAANPGAFFTIPHFDGYAAVLVRLRVVGRRQLRQGIEDAWASCAPTGGPGGAPRVSPRHRARPPSG